MQPQRSIVFVNTKRAAEKVQAFLIGNDIPAEVLSGDVRQNKRQRLIQELASGSLNTLIATDVAARGLHIDGVTHVFNYDLPQNPEDYVHRIGRTARAGASGDAISFACEEYVFSLPEIEQLLGHEIESGQLTDDLLIKPAPPAKIQRNKPPESGKRNNRGGNKNGNRSRNQNRRRKPGSSNSGTSKNSGRAANAGSQNQ